MVETKKEIKEISRKELLLLIKESYDALFSSHRSTDDSDPMGICPTCKTLAKLLKVLRQTTEERK